MSAAEDVQEPGHDPQILDLLKWTGKIAYWIAWPVAITIYYSAYYVSFAILFILKLFYWPLEFILLPVVYLAQFILACLAAPFRFLAKFETLYIYLGIAAIVGLVLGLLVSLTYRFLKQPLGLDSQPAPPRRTAKQYREEKRHRKAKAEAPLMSSGHISPSYFSMPDGMRKNKHGKGLLSQTIMEELDSDY